MPSPASQLTRSFCLALLAWCAQAVADGALPPRLTVVLRNSRSYTPNDDREYSVKACIAEGSAVAGDAKASS